jgi:hypothetical protein
MTLGDAIQPQNYPSFSSTLSTRVWAREAEDFSSIDMFMLYNLLREKIGFEEAQKSVNLIVMKLKLLELKGDIGVVNVKQKQFYKRSFSFKEFSTSLLKLTLTRRQCLLFSLEMSMKLEDVILLKRRDIQALLPQCNDLSKRIIKEQAIHMFKDSLFWEVANGEPRILLGLRHQVNQIFKMNEEDLNEAYKASVNNFHSEFDAMDMKETLMSSIK